MHLSHMSCCAFKELSGIGAQHDNLQREYSLFKLLAQWQGNFRCRFIVFTEATYSNEPRHYGRNFKEFLTALDVGEVAEGPTGPNPNTGRRIESFIWTVNIPRLNAWFDRQIEAHAAPLKEKEKIA